MLTVYILELENNKYYIGSTEKNLEDRVIEHFKHCGSVWTQKFKPIKVIEIVPNADKYDEDKYTKKYMDKFGIDNVRGGSYVTIDLPSFQKKSLQKEFCTSNNKCFKCNKEGHFAEDCKEQDDKCYRCLRKGHFAKDCYAKKDINGKYIKKNRLNDYSETITYCCKDCNQDFKTDIELTEHQKICPNKIVNNEDICVKEEKKETKEPKDSGLCVVM